MITTYSLCIKLTILCPLTVPSAPPDNIIATSLSSTSIRVSWDEVPEIHQNGNITGYTVEITNLKLRNSTLFSTFQRTLTILHLQPHTQYSINVSASTRRGGAANITVTLEDCKNLLGSIKTCIICYALITL